MATTEERLEILKMIESGKITAEEGAKLLAVLKAPKKEREFVFGGPGTARWLRVRVTDTRTGKGKLNVNLPVGLVNIGLKLGARFVPDVEDLDLEELREALRSGVHGKILDAEDEEENERVEIFVE